MKQAGQIALFKFPQTDFTSSKLRPALLLAKLPGMYEDWLISMISTNLNQLQEGIDDIILKESPDFQTAGLKSDSVIRVTRLAVVSGEILTGKIGEISQERLSKIKQNLVKWIKST